jgi:hypothetical protein
MRERSRQDFSRSNLSSAVRKLLAEKLEELGYYRNSKGIDNSLFTNKNASPRNSDDLRIEMERHFFEIMSKNNKTQRNKSLIHSSRPHNDSLYSFSLKSEKSGYITYKANLPWTVMREYLKSLESLGFVRRSSTMNNNEERIFAMSDVALSMLKQYLRI